MLLKCLISLPWSKLPAPYGRGSLHMHLHVLLIQSKLETKFWFMQLSAGGVGSLITQIAKNTGTGCLRSDCSKFVSGQQTKILK